MKVTVVGAGAVGAGAATAFVMPGGLPSCEPLYPAPALFVLDAAANDGCDTYTTEGSDGSKYAFCACWNLPFSTSLKNARPVHTTSCKEHIPRGERHSCTHTSRLILVTELLHHGEEQTKEGTDAA